MTRLVGFAFAAALAATSSGAAAGTLFSNPYNPSGGGDCSFSTTCAASAGRGDDFAAQEFTLAGGGILTSADFTELDLGTQPTEVTWGIFAADGSGGLPGTLLAAGTDVLTGAADGTELVDLTLYDLSKMSWDLGTVLLDPGTYYLAIQATSPVFETYLADGSLASGAAESMDGGVTWSSGYEGFPSVAIDISGTAGVPEPATWLTLLTGVTIVGAALRRRRREITA
jgi:hypothetical protein